MKRTMRATLQTGLLVCSSFASGQPTIQWQKCLGGSNYETANHVQQTDDGGYVVVGYTRSNDGDVSGFHGAGVYGDVWVVKLDATGAIQWQRCLGGSEDEEANWVHQTSDGGYIIAGWTDSNDGDVSGLHEFWGSSDAWVVKLDANGILQWQKCLGGTSYDWAYAVQQTMDGGYVVAGYTNSNNGDVSGNHSGSDDAWVVKLDSDGAIQWQKCLGGTSSDQAYAIQQTNDGGYILTGNTESEDGDVSGYHGGLGSGEGDVWVVKLGPSGVLEWQKCLGGTEREYGEDIRQTSDGGYVMGGWTRSSDGDVIGNHGDVDGWVVKMNGSGSVEWQKCLGGSNAELFFSIDQTADGGFVTTGHASSSNGDVGGFLGGSDAWMVKLSASGVAEWQRCLGGTASESASAVCRTSDDGFIIAGGATGNTGDVSGHHGLSDAWVVKLGSVVGVEETSLNSASIAPNPTTGRFMLIMPQSSQAHSLAVFDATGRMVRVQALGKNAGTIAIDLTGHDSGLYFLHVFFADGTRIVERIVKE